MAGSEWGSPPHMRGKAAVLVIDVCVFGITPAYAGKRRFRKGAFPKAWDHPRVCGEKCGPVSGPRLRQGSPPRMRGKVKTAKLRRRMTGITPAYAGKRPAALVRFHGGKGSPPRMRGKVNAGLPVCDIVGITPAYAGKSLTGSSGITGRRDHPRVCGEKQAFGSRTKQAGGSPPRMRGKAGFWVKDETGRGITPAYAGKRHTAM